MTTLITSREEQANLRAEKEKVNAEYAEKFSTLEGREQIGNEIAQAIYEGFQFENIIELFTDVERLALNGRSTVRRVRGLKAFHTSRGGHIEESFLNSDVAEIPHDSLGFATRVHEDQLELGFSETAATLIQLGTEVMNAAINKRVLKTFQNAVPFGHPSYVQVNDLAASIAPIDAAIAAVKDSSLSDQVAIVGRETMTSKIVSALTQNNSYGAFLPTTNEELFRRGVLGSYRGVQIITLKNFRDGDDVPFFPANELWVIGRDAGKTAFYGGMKSRQELDVNFFWRYRQKMDYGVIVMRPEHTRRIVDTTVQP
jgi:hypothetical protein